MSKTDRRDFLKTGIIAAAAPLVIPGLIGTAFAADNANHQSQWRYCDKCESLFYNGFPTKGSCPVGGGHNAQGYDFTLPHGNQLLENGKAQANWRYCGKCFSMFFDGFPDKGKCSAGGGHAAQGYKFRLPHDINGDATNQTEWRYCGKCHVMFWNGQANKGRCAAGSGHAAAGYVFVLPHGTPPDMRIRSNVTTDGWAPVGGWVEVSSREDGSFGFTGHVHNSGAVNIRFTLAAAIVTPTGQCFGFARNNRLVQGTEVLIGRDRDDNWNDGGSDIEIARNWDQVARARLHWRLVAASTVGARLEALVEDIAKAGLKALQKSLSATPQGQIANFYLKMLKSI